MKFRKKPVEVEAMQYLGWANKDRIREFVGEEHFLANWPDTVHWIKTLEGKMLISEGDYVIKGIQGEFYPCKPDIFEATYDKVGE